VSFLRRILDRGGSSAADPPADDDAGPAAGPDDATDATDEARDLDVRRAEQARLDDLAQRQLRYARYAWTPPTQGGERRAGDQSEGGKDSQGD
jgi:hypothetical protein